MINLLTGENKFIIYGDFTQNMNSYRIHLINGFDKLDHECKLINNKGTSVRFAEFTFYVNDGIIGDYHLNGLPFGNFDYTINIGNNIFNRGQAFLAGDTEIQTIEYISNNEKSESIIYVS